MGNNTQEIQEFNRRIYDRIKRICEKKNVKLGSLEQELKKEKGYFSRVALGKGLLTAHTFVKCCELLHCDMYELAGLDTSSELKKKRIENEIKQHYSQIEILQKELRKTQFSNK